MRTRLDHIESRLQAFVEGGLTRSPLLAQRLLAAIQQSIQVDPQGGLSAPNIYTIFVHPNILPTLESGSDWLARLGNALHEAASQDGLGFASAPIIRLSVDVQLDIDDLRVVAMNSEPVCDTAAFPAANANTSPDPRPQNAFLILYGHHIFPLRSAVVNIGRRTDNHVVLDDPRVSRAHAQLRAVRGRYLLFDLNSTGGTFVNGQRITQYTLKPGDVISLSGVAVIYGEDDPVNSDSDNTTELPSIPDHRS